MQTIDEVLEFLRTHAPGGLYYVYGAGYFGQAAARKLKIRNDISVLGFLDRNAAAIRHVGDRPVVSPDQMHAGGAERVILIHPKEENNMARRLQELGVDEVRLVRAFSHPELEGWRRNALDNMERDLWHRITSLPPPDRDEEYLSCDWIESGMAIMPGDIRACCIGPAGRGRPVLLPGYTGGPLPLDPILQGRRGLQAANRAGGHEACVGCVHLKKRQWPAKAYLFDRIVQAHFTQCNIRCVYCYTVLTPDKDTLRPKFSLRDIYSPLVAENLLDPGAEIFWSGGEPSMLPEFDALLHELCQYGVSYNVSTNGVIRSEALIDALQNFPGTVMLGIDGALPETYLGFKGRDCCETVWANTAAYTKAGGRKVVAKIVLDPRNVGDAGPFVERAHAAGIQRLCYDYNAYMSKVPAELIAAAARIRILADEYGIENFEGGAGSDNYTADIHPAAPTETEYRRLFEERADESWPSLSTSQFLLDSRRRPFYFALFNLRKLMRGRRMDEAIAALQQITHGTETPFGKSQRVLRSYNDIELAWNTLRAGLTALAATPEREGLPELLTLATRKWPQDRVFHLGLGWVERNRGRLDAAIHCVRSALSLDSSCLDAQDALVEIYRQKFSGSGIRVVDGIPIYDMAQHFCPVPFERMETARGGVVWTCCPSFVPVSIGNMHRQDLDAIWNSEEAKEIRRSILDGSFRYCGKCVCTRITSDSLQKTTAIDDPVLAAHILNQGVTLATGPRDLNLSHDSTCNLKCPQCRTDYAHVSAEEAAVLKDSLGTFIKPVLDYAGKGDCSVLMSGDGDVFVSQHYKAILDLFDAEIHGRIKLRILTNGTQFRQGWQDHPNIHPMVQEVTVSTDGASEEVYRLTRGASWTKLVENLEFIGSLRTSGAISQFLIHFAVQTCNFKDMKKILELAERIKVDSVHFHILRNGGTYSPEDYQQRIIFDPAHPRHAEFCEFLRDPIFNSPRANIGAFQSFS